MSDSEKTDELDNFGVWVKNESDATNSSSETIGEDTFDLDTNLPDFSDLDGSDSSPADTAAEDDVTASFLSDFDTDLSDIVTESAEDTAGSEPIEETVIGEEDISLDEFITGGEFEDVAEGNRGYGQAEAPAQESTNGGEESVSLDDFLDMDSLGDAPAEEAAPASESGDDAPLDIDLSFDDNADSLATATVDADVAVEEPTAEAASDDLAGAESIDLSEFGFDEDGEPGAESAPAAEAPVAESEPTADATTETETATEASADNFDDMFNSISDGDTVDASAFFDEPSEDAPAVERSAPTAESTNGGEEEVDLSDFGFDDNSTENQGEVKDGTKAAGGQEDYEMTVTVDDDDSQPVDASASTPAAEDDDFMASVVAAPDSIAETNDLAEEADLGERAAPQATSQAAVAAEAPASSAILSQIVGELNSLRNEIADLKNDFEEMKNKGIGEIAAPTTEENNASIDIPDLPIPEQSESQSGGFFDDNGEDDTIALSTDELSNIMNNADFQTETIDAEGETPLAEETANTTNDETVTESEAAFLNEAPSEDTASLDIPDLPIPEQSESQSGGFFDDNGEDDTIALSTDELSNIMNNADFQTETIDAEGETPLAEENVTERALPTEEADTIDEVPVDDFGFDSIENETSDEAQDLPEEISVPKSDDSADAFPSTEGLEVVDLSAEEPLEVVDLSAESETTTEAEAPAEAVTKAAPVAEAVPAPSADGALDGDLKQEIKSVLSYMDQLLENLPEEKIAEFAQSEQFEKYKKLFKELGLA